MTNWENFERKATEKVLPSYLRFALFQPQMLRVYQRMSRGSTNRRRIEVSEFLSIPIPLPSIDTQFEVTKLLEEADSRIEALNNAITALSGEIDGILASLLHFTFSLDD